MEQIITAIVAAASFIVAYFHRLTKRLEEKNKVKDDRIHNGFRQDVFTAISKQGNEIKELKTDMKLIKKIVINGRKEYKQIEEKKSNSS